MSPDRRIPQELVDIVADLVADESAWARHPQILPRWSRGRLIGWARKGQANWHARADAGKVFHRNWFQVIPAAEVPSEGTVARYWDRASSVAAKGRDPDFTVGCLMRKTRSREYIVIDVVRDRRTPAGVEQLIRETMLRDGRRATQWLEEDPGSAGKAEVSHLTRQLGTNGYVIRTRRPQGSKVERANPLSAMAEQGHVKIVKAPWNEPFLRELHGFPDAAHDDQVDAASGSYSVLSTMRRILVA